MITIGQYGSASKLILEEIQIKKFQIIIGGIIFVSNGLIKSKNLHGSFGVTFKNDDQTSFLPC